ncbi:MAG: cell cycle transcriptional regulator TrcR [Pseudomonadota bacterium]
MAEILMPKATAVWLVDNTGLTFDQISDFTGLHPLEVKGIADGDVAAGVRGADPVAAGQIDREEVEKAEADSSYRMVLKESKYDDVYDPGKRTGPRYTPLSRRQNRPDAIAWLVRNHPELTDGQISKLIGTTKTTISAVRDRTHWNTNNIKPTDPVSLGLTTQRELDAQVMKASSRRAKMEEAGEVEIIEDTLAPAQEADVQDAAGPTTLEELFGGKGDGEG